MYKIVYKINKVSVLYGIWVSNLSKIKLHFFYGNMGIGKTTIISAIISFIDGSILVNSPTFGFCRMYYTKCNNKIAHIDTYKFNRSLILEDYISEMVIDCNYIFIESIDNIFVNVQSVYCLWSIQDQSKSSYHSNNLRVINIEIFNSNFG